METFLSLIPAVSRDSYAFLDGRLPPSIVTLQNS